MQYPNFKRGFIASVVAAALATVMFAFANCMLVIIKVPWYNIPWFPVACIGLSFGLLISLRPEMKRRK
jgi:hypothetical protein